MIEKYTIGDVLSHEFTVSEKDLARFDQQDVHEVLSTFCLGREAEWACRLFVLEMKEDDEEGIGTFLHIEHLGPAFVGQQVVIRAKLESVVDTSVVCSWSAQASDRVIAEGRTGQKVLKREKIDSIFKFFKENINGGANSTQ